MKKIKDPITARNNWVKGKLRFASLKYSVRNEALKLARAERGKYRCAMCEQLFSREKIDIDHVKPVVALDNEGWDWNEFIERLFPLEPSDFQILDKVCHGIKTNLEDSTRTYYSQERKKKDDK